MFGLLVVLFDLVKGCFRFLPGHVGLHVGSVEKGRQRRSRPLAALTYCFVRSARPSGCGLAGRTFLNILLFFPKFRELILRINRQPPYLLIKAGRLLSSGLLLRL